MVYNQVKVSNFVVGVEMIKYRTESDSIGHSVRISVIRKRLRLQKKHLKNVKR